MIKLASWNVNSLTVRLDHVLDWLESSQIDVLALQETKVPDERFPVEAFHALGYQVVFSGQKTYNGVAIVSREPITDVVTGCPELNDPQRRVLAATTCGIRLINVYVPNGSTVDSDKYQYKLNWLTHVTAFIQQELMNHPRLAVVGDFNIAPTDEDVHNPTLWLGQVLVSEPERRAFAKLLSCGLADSFRHFPQAADKFSWWDYRAGAFHRNQGLRIDHILLSEPLLNVCVASDIDATPRRWTRPSDHAPVWVSFSR